MLSILIPTYNYNTTALVKTLQKQAITCAVDFEIIVLDDASSDIQSSTENKKINALEHCSFLENQKKFQVNGYTIMIRLNYVIMLKIYLLL